jgi:hypothetical protein
MTLCFKKDSVGLEGFVDADLSGDLDSQKNTFDFVFIQGGTIISWMSILHGAFYNRSKYVVISKAEKEMVWLLNFLNEIEKDQDCGALYTDSQSALCLTKNTVYH